MSDEFMARLRCRSMFLVLVSLMLVVSLVSLTACISGLSATPRPVIKGAPMPAPPAMKALAPEVVPVPVPVPTLDPVPVPVPVPAAEPMPVPAETFETPPQPGLESSIPPTPGNVEAPTSAVETTGVAARFADPDVSYQTPAFQPGHTGFTSNAELTRWLHDLARTNSAVAKRLDVGKSQAGVPLEALLLSRDAAEPGESTRPTVLLIGQQHGDEPAGSEALLVIAQALTQGSLRALLKQINVVIVARANPDGAATHQRLSASGIDLNRDHLLLRTPEAQALAQLMREFRPVVVLDAHEYSAVGPYLEKFDALQGVDAMVQYASVSNLPEFIGKASEEWFRAPMVKGLKEAGLRTEWYHTTSTDAADKKVSMGGVQPDTARNVNGLRNTVSLLIETRGVGLGREHLKRRVHTHVVAITTVLNSTVQRAAALMKLRTFVDAEVSAKACQGDAIIDADPTPSEYSLHMLDPFSGADKAVIVTWDSALALVPTKLRARPCGYWLAANQTDAVLRLRGLGVQVQQVSEAGILRGENYRETARELTAPSDTTASFADAGGVLTLKVSLVPALLDVSAGSYYVSLEQPLANLVIAALEPDTQNSFTAHRIVTDPLALARVVVRPELMMTLVP